MKRALLLLVAFCCGALDAAHAFTRVPAEGYVYVDVLAARSAEVVGNSGRGFYFVIRDAVDLGAASCGISPANWFVVPRFDPSGTVENLDYREFVDLLLKGVPGPFTLYVEGCINEFPRVVGINTRKY